MSMPSNARPSGGAAGIGLGAPLRRMTAERVAHRQILVVAPGK